MAFGASADDDFKDMRPNDYIVPRLRLQQGLSDMVQNGLAKAGQWADESGKQIVCDIGKNMNVIPITWWNEWIEWNPDKSAQDKKILSRSCDVMSQQSKDSQNRVKVRTPAGKEVNKIDEQYNFLVCVPEYSGNYKDMMQLTFSRSSWRLGREWLNRMRAYKPIVDPVTNEKLTAPLGSAIWEFGSTKEQDKEGHIYFEPSIGLPTLVAAEKWPALLMLKTACTEQKAAFMAASIAQAEKQSNVSPEETLANATAKKDQPPF